MKRRLIVITLAALALIALVCCAHAEYDPLKVSMELSTNRFTEPKEITVTIRVTNTGEDDMSGPVKLFYPNGKQVMDFGEPVLTVGTSQSWKGKWKVTQEQLDARKLTFSIQYPIVNDDMQTVEKTLRFSKTLILESAIPQVVITRTITPTMATKGQIVTIVYEVANTGLIDIQNVRITENKSISGKAGTIAEIKAGAKESYTFEATMNTSNLTSSPAIRYEANGKVYTDSKENVTITYRQVNLTASVKADKKGGQVGDSVKLTLTLSNTGKTPYTDITVTDPTLGELYSGLTLEAGESKDFEQTLPINETANYLFTVTARDTDGTEINTATGQLTVTAIAPSELMDLTVEASAAKDTVDAFPGSVVFTVDVTNNSAAKIENVRVYVAGTKLELYRFPSIEPGETRSFTRELVCSMSGNYQFQAKVVNQLGETKTFDSNRVRISVGAHAAATGSAGAKPVKASAAVMPDAANLSDTQLQAVVEELSGTVDLTSLNESDLVVVLENAAGTIPGLTELGEAGRAALAQRAYGVIQSGSTQTAAAADGESAEAGAVSGSQAGFDFRILAFALLVPALIGTVLAVIGLIGRAKKAASSHKALDHMTIAGIRNYDVTDADEQEPGEEAEDHAKQEIDAQFEQAVEDAAARRRRSADARYSTNQKAAEPEGVKPPENPAP